MLISFEGIDGSGKSTQAHKLLQTFRDKGYKAHLFREPGSTDLGEKLRDILLHATIDPKTELLLFESARVELMEREIKPKLSAGEIVIMDRFIDSTLAYQGYGRGLDRDLVRKLNLFATSGILPDITFLLDIDPTKAIGRIREKSKFDDPEFLSRVREGFLEIAEEEDRVVVISAEKSEVEVFDSILNLLEERVGFDF